MDQPGLIPHLFRTEFRKITAVLSKFWGLENLQLAEDIASDTFLAAAETWPYKGLPENPVAWLYTVAKNKSKNHMRHSTIFRDKVTRGLIDECTMVYEMDMDLSEPNITDSQLQMLFAVCHPSISTAAQVGLALRILCGFGVNEIADAFLTNKETIIKRLARAKEKLRAGKVTLTAFSGNLPDHELMNQRLPAVLTTLYLLFSEGYFSENENAIIRKELCLEAIRLAQLLTANEHTNQPSVNALLSLMCFHSSRLNARSDSRGEMVLYDEQDESQWDQELISKGAGYLHRASTGSHLSSYHLEAAIAYWHTIKTDTIEKWSNVLALYDQLLIIKYSPVAALNRAYALSKLKGKKEAIPVTEKLGMTNYVFYFMLLGELYTDVDNQKAKANFERALLLARSLVSQQAIRQKMNKLSVIYSEIQNP